MGLCVNDKLWQNNDHYSVQFKKKSLLTHGRSSEISRGWGVLKVKSLEAKYEAKLEFPGGRGVQNKKPSVGEYGYFLELDIAIHGVSGLKLILGTTFSCFHNVISSWGPAFTVTITG